MGKEKRRSRCEGGREGIDGRCGGKEGSDGRTESVDWMKTLPTWKETVWFRICTSSKKADPASRYHTSTEEAFCADAQ